VGKLLPGLLETFHVASIAYLVLDGSIVAGQKNLEAIQLFGVVLIAWSLFTKWRIRTGRSAMGPYRFVYFPAYTATLLVVWPVIADYPTQERIIVGMILSVTLLLKSRIQVNKPVQKKLLLPFLF